MTKSMRLALAAAVAVLVAAAAVYVNQPREESALGGETLFPEPDARIGEGPHSRLAKPLDELVEDPSAPSEDKAGSGS